MRARNVSLYKVYDVVLMLFLVVFFVGYINIHSELVGLPHFLPTSDELENFWEGFTWLIFAMLAVDIYLKYRKADNARSFLKKHWLELAMIALVPLFAGLKLAKISIKLVKGMKMMKSGFKVAHGAKKMAKEERASESSWESL
jgi:hypothetical protein